MTVAEAPLEMSVRRRKAEQIFGGLESEFNLHLLKLLGFVASDDVRSYWKKEPQIIGCVHELQWFLARGLARGTENPPGMWARIAAATADAGEHANTNTMSGYLEAWLLCPVTWRRGTSLIRLLSKVF